MFIRFTIASGTLLPLNRGRCTQQKSPTNMWSSQKHKNIDALGSGTARTGACILAFFKVVASSQICPHLFEGAKIIKKSDMQTYVSDRHIKSYDD